MTSPKRCCLRLQTVNALLNCFLICEAVYALPTHVQGDVDGSPEEVHLQAKSPFARYKLNFNNLNTFLVPFLRELSLE